MNLGKHQAQEGKIASLMVCNSLAFPGIIPVMAWGTSSVKFTIDKCSIPYDSTIITDDLFGVSINVKEADDLSLLDEIVAEIKRMVPDTGDSVWQMVESECVLRVLSPVNIPKNSEGNFDIALVGLTFDKKYQNYRIVFMVENTNITNIKPPTRAGMPMYLDKRFQSESAVVVNIFGDSDIDE